MKSKVILLTLGSISLVMVFSILSFLLAPNYILSLVTPDISLKDENFDGIYLNENIHKLDADKLSEDILNPNFYDLSNGLSVITDENKNIRKMAITQHTDKNVKTIRGISVGDSLENVKKYYGDDYYKRREQGVEIIVFEDQKKFLEFWFWNNEVQEIRLGYNE